jgi:hypothetical protein
MSEDENALVTGDYVITPYRLQGEQTKAVCILKGQEGEWWYSINDGLLDVGPFASREAAIEWAMNSIDEYHRYMGGHVRSVSVVGEAAAARRRNEAGKLGASSTDEQFSARQPAA